MLCDCLAWVQDSDFLYLTGIDQQAVAVIEASSPMRDSSFTLYLPDTDAQVQLCFLCHAILDLAPDHIQGGGHMHESDV